MWNTTTAFDATKGPPLTALKADVVWIAGVATPTTARKKDKIKPHARTSEGSPGTGVDCANMNAHG